MLLTELRPQYGVEYLMRCRKALPECVGVVRVALRAPKPDPAVRAATLGT